MKKKDIWTLVSLKPTFSDGNETEGRRAPVDIVAVIDVFGSMFGEKLDLFKKTFAFFLTQSKNLFNLIGTFPQ